MSTTRRATKKSINAIDANATMNMVSGGLRGGMENFHVRQREVEAEIREDNKGLHEIDNELYKLNKRKAILEERIAEGQAWMDNYEKNIAPFAGQYDQMVSGIGEIYINAKDGHQKGLDMLQKEFDYHPTYKRHSDTFSAVPFKPQ